MISLRCSLPWAKARPPGRTGGTLGSPGRAPDDRGPRCGKGRAGLPQQSRTTAKGRKAPPPLPRPPRGASPPGPRLPTERTPLRPYPSRLRSVRPPSHHHSPRASRPSSPPRGAGTRMRRQPGGREPAAAAALTGRPSGRGPPSERDTGGRDVKLQYRQASSLCPGRDAERGSTSRRPGLPSRSGGWGAPGPAGDEDLSLRFSPHWPWFLTKVMMWWARRGVSREV